MDRERTVTKQNPQHPVVFTPDNEPYLGRQKLYTFDLMISYSLQQNALIAPRTHEIELSDAQQMACVVIPQAISIALSVRELLRQGYLFGANVLIRPLVERAAILLYLQRRPGDIEKWKRGWKQGDAPSLGKMLEVIQEANKQGDLIKGFELTDGMNILLHSRPESGLANLVPLDDNRMGYAVSKLLNRPDLCDNICDNVIPWLAAVTGSMAIYFGKELTT
jgi:hypothetical protein